MNWADKFQDKLRKKELASQEARKSFGVYQKYALELFDSIESKVKSVEVINVVRTVIGHSGPAPGPIKALTLKCHGYFIKFIPEGINLDDSRGRVRIEHNAKALSKFIYMHLIIDRQSDAPYPENLLWVLNINGETDIIFEELPPFGDKELENLIETCFLG